MTTQCDDVVVDIELPVELPIGQVPGGGDLLGFLKSLADWPTTLFTVQRFEGGGEFVAPEGLFYAPASDDAAKKIEQAWDANFDVLIIEVSESIPPDSELPKIILSNTQLDDLADEVIEALIRANDPPKLFVRAEGIVHVRRGASPRRSLSSWRLRNCRAATRPPMPRGLSKAAGGALNSESCLVRTHPVNKDETDTRREGNDRNSK